MIASITTEGYYTLIAIGLFAIAITAVILNYMAKYCTPDEEKRTFKDRVKEANRLIRDASSLQDVINAERWALRNLTRSEIENPSNAKDICMLNKQFQVNWAYFKGRTGAALNLYSYLKDIDYFIDEMNERGAFANTLTPII